MSGHRHEGIPVVHGREDVTVGDNDTGVPLSDRESVRLACWLLRDVLSDWDWYAVRAALNSTRWQQDADREDLDDATHESRTL